MLHAGPKTYNQEYVDELQAELADLRKLAGEIAASNPMDPVYPNCRYCEGNMFVMQEPDHAPDCLWIRAQRWKP